MPVRARSSERNQTTKARSGDCAAVVYLREVAGWWGVWGVGGVGKCLSTGPQGPQIG